MPLPKPKSGETRDDFFARCMGNSVMVAEFPDAEQRGGVCGTQWSRHKTKQLSAEFDMVFSGGTGRDWIELAAKESVKGVPRQKFRKVVIRKGEFYKEAGDQHFKVDDVHLENWVEQFERMQENGVKVWIPASHDDGHDAESLADPLHSDQTRGYVLDLFRQGDNLVMDCEMIGEDGIAAAARNDVSIFSPVSYTDGDGHMYEQPIRHVTLCPDPVITGLGDFIPIAASSKGNGMAFDWKKLGSALGIDDLTEENAHSKIAAAFKAKKAKTKEDVKASSKENEPEKKETETEKEKTTPINPILLSSVAKARRTELNSLVADGHITPAVRDTLFKDYVGDDVDHPEKLSLALSSGVDDGFDRLISTLQKNKPSDLVERTGRQTMVLSQEEAPLSEENNPLIQGAKQIAEREKALQHAAMAEV